MRKRIWPKIGVALAIATIIAVLVALPTLADSPPDKSDPPLDSSPAYPTSTPPSEPPTGASPVVEVQEQTQNFYCSECADKGIGLRYACECRGTCYTPWKSGTSARGAARTTTNCPGFNNTTTDVWLWKWVTDHWVIVSHDQYGIYIPPATECVVITTYNNATSAYYADTSRHRVFNSDMGTWICDFWGESDYVWLSY
jgi:hypothetical protein